MSNPKKRKLTIAAIAALGLSSCYFESSEGAKNTSIPTSEATNTSKPGHFAQTQQSSALDTSKFALSHQTDFLTGGQFTHLYPSFNSKKRKNLRKKFKKSGYTHMYIYIMNQNDYGGPAFNFYEKADRYKLLLEELLADGIAPVVWLAPDDAPDLHNKYNEQLLKDTWKKIIPVLDPLVSSYVLGLEMDEYWSAEQQDRLGIALKKLTDKPIFVHLRTSKWKPVLLDWASGIIYQYGFGKTVEQITQETTSMLAILAKHPHKTFIAGEYSIRQSQNKSRKLGDAAINAGAMGFGNGGTPFLTKP